MLHNPLVLKVLTYFVSLKVLYPKFIQCRTEMSRCFHCPRVPCSFLCFYVCELLPALAVHGRSTTCDGLSNLSVLRLKLRQPQFHC